MLRHVTLALILTAVGLTTGCTHVIAFHPTDTSWHYSVGADKQTGAALVAVIDETTAEESYAFRAWSTGIAQKWVANYGEMLEQAADVELPQIVERYERSSAYLEPTTEEKRLTLVLTAPSYVFEGWRAKMTVQAEAFGPGRTPLFSKSYSAEGGGEAGKMVGLGAFGQKSAVRQSSLDALKKIFAQMRPDIVTALQGPQTSASSGSP
jgi:hypothetical protein